MSSDWSRVPRWTRFWYRVSNFLGFLQAIIHHRFIGEPVWRSSDGRITPIKDLEDSHLNNIVRMLQRQWVIYGKDQRIAPFIFREHIRRMDEKYSTPSTPEEA